MKITLTDLDLFLDELRHRCPNVEPVVRVRRTSRSTKMFTTFQLQATYLRQYGERVATVELLSSLGSWVSWNWTSLYDDAETIGKKNAEQKELYDNVVSRCAERYAADLARIAAVAGEIGIDVAGGEVTV